MSETRPDPVPIKDAGRSVLSLVWLVPLAAVLIAAWVAWQNWSQQGPLIEVAFDEADGLNAGETELRYRDISVGQVEDVRFSDDLARVIATIRLDKTLAPFVDAEAQFWIVRPEVTAQGVSGLDTVLSGVYIAGAWDDTPGLSQTRFSGLAKPPLLALGESGVTFTLRSDTELPPAGTPILYRGVQVGRLGPAVLDEGGLTASAQAVILAPHDALITSATRFWDISGVDFSLGAQGAQIDFDSLASLITGGVTFETLASGGARIEPGSVYVLHADEDTAREAFFVTDNGGTVDLVAVFDENLPGLQTGAAVTLGGLRLGQVVAISGIVDPARFGDNQARLLTTMRLSPARLGLETGTSREAFLGYLEDRVRDGLRARLATGSILTGGLKVELVDLPDATAAVLDPDATPFPSLPTAPARVTDVSASAQGVLTRIEALPIEEVLAETIGLLGDIRSVIGSEDIQRVPGTLARTLEAIEDVAASDEIAALPGQIADVVTRLSAASEQLTALMTEIDDQAVVIEVAELIRTLDATAETLPGLSAEAQQLLAQVSALPLDQLTSGATAALADARALLQSEDLAALPGDARDTLDSLRGVIEDEALAALPQDLSGLASDAQRALERLDGVLADVDAKDLVGDLDVILGDLQRAAADLPGLTQQAGNVLSEAEALALQDLAAQLGAVLEAVGGVVDQDSTRDLPGQLNDTLDGLQATLKELRAGGVVANANAALAAARDAAEAVSAASETLPALSNRLSQVAGQASATLADFDRRSEFGRDLSNAIEQIEAAALAIERLARQIARNPNSLLTGR